MEQKIQELTDKIYREGVEKGETEARKIIAEATEKAATITAEAKKSAEKSIADAKQLASELKRTTEAEIKFAGNQALSTIKQQVIDLITAKLVDGNISSSLNDPATIKEMLSIIVTAWKSDEGSVKLEALLPLRKQDELCKALEQDSSDLMKQGLTLSFSKIIKSGFRIGPVDGAFKISLTDEDFSEFFKEYLRPRTRAYLFGN